MKTEWELFFSAREFIFAKEHKYVAKASSKNGSSPPPGDLKDISFNIRIKPDGVKGPGREQTGSLFIILPLPYEESKKVIYSLASNIAERISFEWGDFKILGGMISCKSIPETPEEEKEVGDKPYHMEVRIREVVDPPEFDTKDFVEKSKASLDIRLVSQYNAARKSHNPIDKFLGFFRILESQFMATSGRHTLRESLEGSGTLFSIYEKTFKFESTDKAHTSFLKFVRDIIHARHRCAHLKAKKDFGYVPIDPKIGNEVEPLLVPLEILTYETIMNEGNM